MPLRDFLIFLIVFGSIPIIFKRPYWGVIVSAWLGYMNPHRLSWGPAYSFPFVALIAAVTIISFISSSENKKLPNNIAFVFLVFLVVWISITTSAALNPSGAVYEWKRFIKIQILNLLAIYLCQERNRIIYLTSVIVFSIGFYSFKGGIFTLATGGVYRVNGPPGSFIGGNTEIGFASTVILPLMFFLYTLNNSKMYKMIFGFVLMISSIGIMGTHSRGAFLAFGVLCIYFWWVSRSKLIVLFLLICLLPVMFSFMPDEYFDRMQTIRTYEEDGSAMGRINAWWFAFNLANDRPLLGGGANAFTSELFYRYAPEPEDRHDAHSVYFEMLGEQGYPGLLFFVAMLFFSFRNCVWVERKTRGDPERKWAYDLSRMLKASFVAYAVGGAFLGLAYFDLLYHLVALTILLRTVIEKDGDSKQGSLTSMP